MNSFTQLQTMTGAQILTLALENEGVEFIFGLPGEETIELNEALRSGSIKFVLTKHEQAAAFAADGYGRVTDRAGVCLSTLGPGATNLVTGVANANLDHSKLVAISIQDKTEDLGRESHQLIDIEALFKPITKWNAQCANVQEIPELVREAFRQAQDEPSGAAHLSIPNDLLEQEIEYDTNAFARPLGYEYGKADEEALELARKLIEESKVPLIIAGNGVVRNRAWQEVREFSRHHNIGVAHTYMALGTMTVEDKLNLGAIGLQDKDYNYCLLEKADLVIAVGYDLVEYDPENWNKMMQKKIININTYPAPSDKFFVPEVELLGDISETLEALDKAFERKFDESKYIQEKEFIEKSLWKEFEEQKGLVTPQEIVRSLNSILNDEDFLISDVGAHKVWLARLLKRNTPDSTIFSNGLASMGGSLAQGIGVQKAFPDRNVLVVVGDGGFVMNEQELETVVRERLPITILIWEDGNYGQIEWKQKLAGYQPTDVNFANPDFVELGRAYGIEAERAETNQELIQKLKTALAGNEPRMIIVPVDYSQNMQLTKELGRLVCIN